MAGYIVWRALRTLNPGWSYFFSVPIWACEFAGFVLSNVFVMSLWNQIVRSPRKLEQMLPPEDMPSVDVFVPTYSGAPYCICCGNMQCTEQPDQQHAGDDYAVCCASAASHHNS
jgi:hypothetical protein